MDRFTHISSLEPHRSVSFLSRHDGAEEGKADMSTVCHLPPLEITFRDMSSNKSSERIEDTVVDCVNDALNGVALANHLSSSTLVGLAKYIKDLVLGRLLNVIKSTGRSRLGEIRLHQWIRATGFLSSLKGHLMLNLDNAVGHFISAKSEGRSIVLLSNENHHVLAHRSVKSLKFQACFMDAFSAQIVDEESSAAIDTDTKILSG